MPIKFDAEDKLLGEVFTSQERYRIPRYQRPYSWTTDQVSDLWTDLQEEDSAYLGSLVFNYEKYETEKFVEVIDGQQRLITITILLAVIRDIYKELEESDKSELTQNIIAFKNLISGEETYRLKCGESINAYFCENIQKSNKNGNFSKTKKSEERRVRDNYEFLKEKIYSEISDKEEQSKKISYLDDLKKKIFDFKIILIRIENDEDAYSIFETVNDRGADLTAADLLKNYLFGKLPPARDDGIDEAKELWSSMENNIEGARGMLNVSKFIRYYWLSKYSFVSEKKLYKEIKKTITNPKELLEDLYKASEYYVKISNSSATKDDWIEIFEDRDIAQKIADSLSGLRIMNITQCYSLIFCLLLNKDKINFDISNYIKAIENYHFAYSAVCKLSGNVVEKLYYKTAQDIQDALKMSDEKKRNKNIQRVLDLFKNKLAEHYPSRDTFMDKFMDIEYKNYLLVVYILSSIERRKNYKELKFQFDRTNIEHILPKDPTEWGLTKNETKDFVNKFGNLTLIAETLNSKMSNKKLIEKSEVLEKSKLHINNELFEKIKNLNFIWGEKEINDRQREMAEYAYNEVWKFN